MAKLTMIFLRIFYTLSLARQRVALGTRSLLVLLGFLSTTTACLANPSIIKGSWYLQQRQSEPLSSLPVQGGDFVFKGRFTILQSGDYVIDFKNTSTIGLFHHTITTSYHEPVAMLEGGIQSRVNNPFALRHGREIHLEAGQYELVTSLRTPFLIAQPTPYIDDYQHYQQAIKPSNLITLVCWGILLGLGVYYLALSLARKQMTESMYALFIGGNLLLQGTSLLIFSDNMNVHWFYLSALPILFSNMAYIWFVKCLLVIEAQHHPKLHRMIQCGMAILIIFSCVGILFPHWMMEMARYGVGVFLSIGLICGGYLSIKGNMTARFYLIAILVFSMLGALTITAQTLNNFTFYVEHLGLIAVTVEALLLALVLSYQFYVLLREKEQTLRQLGISQQQAQTDNLTGLPNRMVLESSIQSLPKNGSLTFLDLDNLKYYNDYYGHAHGDNLLRSFSRILQQKLANFGTLHRLGGDEFAITCPIGDELVVNAMLDETVNQLREEGFDFSGFSAGTAFVYENSSNFNVLMHMADERMYENKHSRKKENKRSPNQ